MATENLTNNPLLTSSAGEEVTAQDQQLINDFADLTPSSFINRYGQDTFDSMVSQQEALRGSEWDTLIAQHRSPDELIKDSAKNIITGAVTGLVDPIALGTGLLGIDKISEMLARASKGINDFSQSLGSEAEQAQQRDYSLRQQGLSNRLDREYKEDIQKGMSETEATLNRLGKEAFNTVSNLLRSGQYTSIASSGLGSIISGGIATKGLTSAAKVAGKALPSLTERAMGAYEKANPITKKIADASPWMVSMGMQEGGSQYSQQLLEGLDIPIEDLYANSPAFVRSVEEHMQNDPNISKEEAEEAAKRDMAIAAAKEAGVETGIAAAVANIMTAGLAKPFTRRLGQSRASFLAEGATEPLEEGISEGAGTIASNRATQRYLDQNQELTEGLGQSIAEGAIGGFGIVGPRVASSAVGASLEGLGVVARKTQETLSPKNEDESVIRNRIDNLERSIPTVMEEVATSTDSENINNVVGKLKAYTDEVTNTAKDESTGENVSTLTPERSVELLDNIQKDKAIVENTMAKDDAVSPKLTTAKTKTNQVLSGLETKIISGLNQKITNQRSNYQNNPSLSQEQLNLEGAYLSALSIQDMEKAKQDFNGLPENVKTALNNTTFSNASIQEKMNTLLDRKPQETTTNTTEAQTTATPTTTVTKAPADSIQQVYANIEDVSPLSQEEITNLPEDSGDISIADSNYSINVRANGSIYLKDTNSNRLYPISNEQAQQLNESINDPEQFANVLTPIIKNIEGSKLKNGQHYVVNTNGNNKIFSYNGEKAFVDGKEFSISEPVKNTLDSITATEQEKTDAVASLFNEEQAQFTRSAEDLSPKKLAKQNKYLEDGIVKDYSSAEVKQSFSDNFGKTFSNLVTPVRRAIYLWQSDSPIKSLMDLLGSYENVSNYLRMNQFTNAENLANSLFTVNKKLDLNTTTKHIVDGKDSIINQLRAMLNPDGQYMQKFMKNAAFTKNEDMPQAFKDIFYDENGQPKQKLVELASIAGVQWLSMLSAYKHELNKDELIKYGIDPSIQEKDFSTIDGVIMPMAMQNLATTLRKIMGVAINNDALLKDYQDFFGTFAVLTAKTMADAGLINNLQTVSINRVTDDNKIVKENLILLNPNPDYTKLFRPKASILLSLLDPTFRNAWSTVPSPVKTTISGTSKPITKAQHKAVELENNKGYSINSPFVHLLEMIGWEDGFTNLFGEPAENIDRKFANRQEFISRKGRLLSNRLGFDFIREVMFGNLDKPLDAVKVYFSAVVLKNGRIMYEGAATTQSNKLVRQMAVAKDEPLDLTDKSLQQFWKLTLAQKFGESVNKKLFSAYENKINEVLDFIGQNLDTLAFLTNDPDILTDAEMTKNRENLKDFIEKFNALGDYKINGEESLNALIEAVRFKQASEGQLKKFDSYIFLELDGINDGPSNINSLFGRAMNSFTPKFVMNSFKTGNNLGLAATSQEMLASGTEAVKVTGTNGQDLHAEVSQKAIVTNILRRVIELNKEIQNPKFKDQSKKALEQTTNLLKLFKEIGWLEGDIPDLTKITSVPKTLPFKFDREISKVLTTVIPYGSEVKGSTQQVFSYMMDSVYQILSDKMIAVAEGKESYAKANKKVTAIMQLLQNMLKANYLPNAGFATDTEIAGLVDGFNLNLPTKDELVSAAWRVKEGSSKLDNPTNPEKADTDLRNFMLTNDGMTRLINLGVAIFGEPAQAAINEVIGNDGMRGARIPTLAAGLLNIVARALEQRAIISSNGLYNLTPTDMFNLNKHIDEFGPNFTFPSGSTAVIRKTKFVTSGRTVYKDSATGYAYNDSVPLIDSAGVSGGPLVVQSVGDASMVLYSATNLAEAGIKDNQVYDGRYVSPDNAVRAGEIINEASNMAQRQRVIASIAKRLEQVGNRIIAKGWSKKTDAFDALIDCITNIAMGNDVDGSPLQKSSYTSNELQREIKNLVNKVLVPNTFEPSLQKTYENYFNQRRLTLYTDKDNIKVNLSDELDTVKTFIRAVQLNEEVQEKTLNKLPKTTHHMSGSTGVYVQGKPLSIAKAKECLDAINAIHKDNPFANFAELLSAYLNSEADMIYARDYALSSEYTKKEKQAWLDLTGRSQGNSGYRSLADKESIEVMHSFFKKDASRSFRTGWVKNGVKEYTKKDIQKVFSQLGSVTKNNAIFNTLYKKVQNILPSNTKIFVASNRADFPKDIQNKFPNESYVGLYTVNNGIPEIYIVDKDNAGINSNSVATTIVHEAIHAAVSANIQQYFADKTQLTAEQQKAISNLEALLKDFMDSTLWEQDIIPASITRIRDILSNISDPAERLDELTAYVMSNQQVMEAFADYKLKNTDRHAKNFGKLLSKIVKAVRFAWKKLLNIVTGSPMDQALTYESSIKLLKQNPLDFLGLYGANTLVLLNETQKIKRSKRKSFSGTRNMITDPTVSYLLSSKLKNAITDRVRVYETFKSTRETNKTLQDRLNARTAEEMKKATRYKDSLYHFVKSYLSNPGDFTDQAVWFMRKDLINPSTKNMMFQAYKQVYSNITPDFMVKDKSTVTAEELEASKQIYDLIKGESSFDKLNLSKPEIFDPKFGQIAILFALANTNPEVNNAIGKIKIPVSHTKKSFTNPLDSLEHIAQELTEQFAKENLNNKSLKDSADIILEETNEYLQPVSDKWDTWYNRLFHSIDYGVMSVFAGLAGLISPNAKDRIKEFRNTLSLAPVQAYTVTTEAMRSGVNKIKVPLLVDLLKDTYARTPSNTPMQAKLKRIKGFFDKERLQYLDEYPEYLIKLFKKTEITQPLRRFLFKSLGTTKVFLFSTDEAKDLLTNENKLITKINALENELREDSSGYADDYLRKIKQLANYLTGDRKAGHNLLTNEAAIAKLLGEKNQILTPVSANTIRIIGQLISAYSIKNFSKEERAKLQEIYKNDEEAITTLIAHLQELSENETQKVNFFGDTSYVNNFLFGAMPKGNIPSGHYALVPKSKEAAFKKKGYKSLGIYKASSIDSSETYVRMYCEIPQMQEYAEGILQGINQTSFGWLVGARTRNEAMGAKVTQRDTLKHIRTYYSENEKGLELIPIYNEDGIAIGYERSIPPKDRSLIEKDNDIFTGMAQQLVRQRREVLADQENYGSILLAQQEYADATEEEKQSQFIDVLHTDNPIIKAGVERLSRRTRSMISQQFGDHLYLKRDVVDTFLGHQRMSLTDIWDNKFILPKSVEDGITKCLEAIFGERARYYIGNFEKGLMSVATFARDTIIIRSGIVAFANAAANTISLHLVLGMPFKEIARYYKETVIQTQQYNKLAREIRELEFKQISATPAEKERIAKEIKLKNLEIENMPIYRLINEGEYSTISAEGSVFEEAEIIKHKADDWINSKVAQFNKGKTAKTAVSNLLMLKGSTTYRTMAEAINLGDWVAKVTGYRYLTESSKEYKKPRMGHDQARNIVSTLFVDYDQPVGREREWTNRMGLTWFMTYKWRMVAAAMFAMFTNPSRTILGTLVEGSTDVLDVGTAVTENIVSKVASGDVSYSVGLGMLWRGLFMHPLAMILGFAK